MYYRLLYESPIGLLTVIGSETHVLSVTTERQIPPYSHTDIADSMTPVLQEMRIWLDEYFAGKQPDWRRIPLKLKGTAFQLQIWDLLTRIPYGQTVTYGEIAKLIAVQRGISKMSSQAVGQAVGANPAGIIIPCHRVIGSNGKLTGYAGGVDNKCWLLEFERSTK